jgi:hypothetical protein
MLRVCCRDGWGEGDDCVDLGDCAGCVGCGICGLFCVVRMGVVDVVGGDVFVGGELGVVFLGVSCELLPVPRRHTTCWVWLRPDEQCWWKERDCELLRKGCGLLRGG